MFRDRHRRTQENAQLLTLAIWHIKSTSSSTIAYGQNCMTAEPGIVAVVPVAVRVSPGATYLLCAISRKRHVSMRRLWALHIFSLLSCCGLRTSSNKTSYAYRTVVRNSWRVKLRIKLTDAVSFMISRITVRSCSGLVWSALMSAPSTPRRTMSRIDSFKVRPTVDRLKYDQLTSSEMRNVVST